MAASRTIRTIAGVIIAAHAVGVIANGISLALGDPRYAPGLWLAFLLLKLTGVLAGVLLWQGRRAGAWLFGASLLAGAAVALGFAGPYPLALWLGAGLLLVAILGGFALAMRRGWAGLR